MNALLIAVSLVFPLLVIGQANRLEVGRYQFQKTGLAFKLST